jgi:hypothetical protein
MASWKRKCFVGIMANKITALRDMILIRTHFIFAHTNIYTCTVEGINICTFPKFQKYLYNLMPLTIKSCSHIFDHFISIRTQLCIIQPNWIFLEATHPHGAAIHLLLFIVIIDTFRTLKTILKKMVPPKDY